MLGIRRVTTKRTINRGDLYNLCVKQQYYTCGDCKAYEELLSYVEDKDIDSDDIIAIASNIYNHSDIKRIANEYGVSNDEVFNSIYFNVGQLVNWFCESSMI